MLFIDCLSAAYVDAVLCSAEGNKDPEVNVARKGCRAVGTTERKVHS